MVESGDVYFKQDIVEEMAKKTGYSKDKCLKNIEFIIYRLRKISKDPDVASIYLPNLGTVYFKSSYARHEIKRQSRKRVNENLKEKCKNIEKLDKKKKYIKHIAKSRYKNNFFNKGYNTYRKQKHQNQDYDGYKQD